MIIGATTWNDEAARDGAEPVIVLQFDNSEYNSNPLTLATHEFDDMPTDTLDILGTDLKYQLAVDPLVGVPSTSLYNFSVIDRDSVFTGIIADNPEIYKDIVHIYVGFKAIDFADFIEFPRALVQNFQLESDMLTYRIDAVEFILGLPKPIFRSQPTTRIVADASGSFDMTSGPSIVVSTSAVRSDSEIIFERVSSSGTPSTAPTVTARVENTSFTVTAPAADNSIYRWDLFNGTTIEDQLSVDNATGLDDPSDLPAHAVMQAVLDISGEIVYYTGKNTAGIPDLITGCERGQRNTTARRLKSGDVVNQVYDFYHLTKGISFAEHVLNLLLTTEAGSNGYWDVSIAGAGLGISESDVDDLQIIDIASRYHIGAGLAGTSPIFLQVSYLMTYLARSDDDLSDFLEKIAFALVKPAFLFVDTDNKLKLKLPNPVYDITLDATLTDDDIESLSFEINHYDLINRVRLNKSGAAPAQTGSTLQTQGYEYDQSVSVYGESEWYDIFLPDGSWGLGFASYEPMYKNLLFRLLTLYGRKSVTITVTVKWENILLQIGDLVAIEYTNLPAYTENTWQGYVVGKRVNFLGSITYSVLCFNAFDELAEIDSSNEVTSFTEDEITKDSDFTSSIEAEDGYYNNTSNNYEGQLYLVELSFDPPQTATTEYRRLFVTIGVVGALVDNVYDFQANYEILYQPSSTETRTVILQLDVGQNLTPDYVKIDWWSSNASGADEPTLINWDKLTIIKTIPTFTVTDNV